MWFTPGILLALGYTTFLYRKFAGKIRLERPTPEPGYGD
jgi:cytochrome bd-type quinol oxidase subunit 2